MEKNDFVIANVLPGRLNAMVKNIMKQLGIDNPIEAVRMVNAGEVEISIAKAKYREVDGVIYFSVTSDGTTGEEWIVRLDAKGRRVNGFAKGLLRSNYFNPAKPTTYEVAVLKGGLFSDKDRITSTIRKDAKNRQFSIPNAEIACLIREKFSEKELKAMGLYWIVVMHEPIKDVADDFSLLSASRDDGGFWLSTSYGNPGSKWFCGNGFAFVVSQVELRS